MKSLKDPCHFAALALAKSFRKHEAYQSFHVVYRIRYEIDPNFNLSRYRYIFCIYLTDTIRSTRFKRLIVLQGVM